MQLMVAVISIIIVVFIMFTYWDQYAPVISKSASEGLQGLLGGWS